MRLKELLNIIKERRSIREFSNEKINDEKVRLLIDAARHAPSNNNRQAWKFIILKNEKIKYEIEKAVHKKIERLMANIQDDELSDLINNYKEYFLFFSQAPVVIIALYKTMPSIIEHMASKINEEDGPQIPESELMSVAMAVQNLLLATHTMGLGACCMTSPLIASSEMKKILDIRPPFEIAALIPIGKYKKKPEALDRKEINKIIKIIE